MKQGFLHGEQLKAVDVIIQFFQKNPNENTISDYFHILLHSDEKVYLVTRTEIIIEGADREPLLMDVMVLKEITHYYRDLKE